MMLVYSPVIGWGFFGMGNARLLQPDHPLYLNSAFGYILLTFTVHVVYGLTLGLLTNWLIRKKEVSKIMFSNHIYNFKPSTKKPNHIT